MQHTLNLKTLNQNPYQIETFFFGVRSLGLPNTKKKRFGFDTDFGLKPNVFSSRVATDFHTLDQHTETSMKGGGGDRKRSASSSLHRTNPRPNHRPNQSSQHVISQLIKIFKVHAFFLHSFVARESCSIAS